MTSFNLVHEPWVLVLDVKQTCHEVSLVDVFTQADRWRGLAGEMPTQQAALLRFLLAVCHRALREDVLTARAGESWAEWWHEGFPTERVTEYIRTWRHRFDLFDDEAPFMQVAGLHTAKGSTSGLSKLIADIPDGEAFFTTRAGSGLNDISAAEAARWLIHCQAYDPSGIKSGAVGDDRVKGGKGYPIGTGWCGQIGMVVAEGSTLAETLLLNLVLEEPSPEGDLAVWEREPPMTAAMDFRLGEATKQTGPVELLAWQSRRVRLIPDNAGRVVDALICNGDRITAHNRHHGEAMTAWRRSANQEKGGDHGPVVYMPVTHRLDRVVWRGLGGLLAGASTSRGAADDIQRLIPRLLNWLARLVDEQHLDADHPVRFRVVGMAYGSQSSVVSGVVDDAMSLHVSVLTDQDQRQAVLDAVDSTDRAVQALCNFAGNLAQAAGGATEGARERAAERAWSVVDGPFRQWAAALGPQTDIPAALTIWHRTADRTLRRVGLELVMSASDKAWRGREVTMLRGRHFVDTALAEAWFRAALAKALDRASHQPEPAVAGPSSSTHEGN